MAKQLVNPIERHIEKAVVAVAGLLLVGVIARFIVTSPNKIDIGQESVTPSTIDAKVAQKAASIQQKIASATNTVAAPEPLSPKFEASLSPIKQYLLPVAVALGPEVPIVDSHVSTEGKRSLATVMPLDKPQLTWGRSTFKIGDSFQPANWVTVSSSVDMKAQTELQHKHYGAQRREVVFGPFELERRARRSDGSWSDGDWKLIEPYPKTSLPRPPQITLVNEGGKQAVAKDAMGGINNYSADLVKPTMQRNILRPVPPVIANGANWAFPIITKCEDVLRQDDEYDNPDKPPSASPDDRYGLCAPTVAKAVPQGQRLAADLDLAEKMIQTALANQDEALAIQANNTAVAVLSDATASSREKERATAIQKKADQAEQDIRIRKRTGPAPTSPGQQPKPGDTKPVRDRLPKQQAWVMDAQPGSVESGRVYQYRMRMTLLNRLIGESDKFANPADAAVIFVPGEWSEPSEPITIPSDLEFYVTGDAEKDEQVSVEFFQWYDGVWVASKRAKLGINDAMSAESRSQVPSLDDPNVPFNALVPFDAENAVIDIDFSRAQRERKKGTGKRGFKISGPPGKAATMAFVDANGEVFERWVPTDKVHPGKRAAGDRTWKPKKP